MHRALRFLVVVLYCWWALCVLCHSAAAAVSQNGGTSNHDMLPTRHPVLEPVAVAQWQHAGALPYPIFHASHLFINQSLFLLGGCPTRDCAPSHVSGIKDAHYYTSLEYEPATGRSHVSEALLPLQEERGIAGEHAAVAITGTVYVVRSCSLSLSDHEREAVMRGLSDGVAGHVDATGEDGTISFWQRVSSSLSSRRHGWAKPKRSSATHQEEQRRGLASAYSPIVALYPDLPAINETFYVLPSNRARVNASCAALGNQILIMGGVLVESGRLTSSVDVFDVVTRRFDTDVAFLTEPVMSPAVVSTSEGTVVVAGGWTSGSRMTAPSAATQGGRPKLRELELTAGTVLARSKSVSVLMYDQGEEGCVTELANVPSSVARTIVADPLGCHAFVFGSNILVGNHNMSHMAVFDLRAAAEERRHTRLRLKEGEHSSATTVLSARWHVMEAKGTMPEVPTASDVQVLGIFSPIIAMTTETVPAGASSTMKYVSDWFAVNTDSSSASTTEPNVTTTTTTTSVPTSTEAPPPLAHNMTVVRFLRLGGELLVQETHPEPPETSSSSSSSSSSENTTNSSDESHTSTVPPVSHKRYEEQHSQVVDVNPQTLKETEKKRTPFTGGQPSPSFPGATTSTRVAEKGDTSTYFVPAFNVSTLLLDNHTSTVHPDDSDDSDDSVPPSFLFLPTPDLPADHTIDAPTGQITLSMPPTLDYTAFCKSSRTRLEAFPGAGAIRQAEVLYGTESLKDVHVSRTSLCALRLSSRRDCLGNAAGTLDAAYDGSPGTVLGFSASGSSRPVYVCVGVRVHVPPSSYNPFEPVCEDRLWFHVLNPRTPLTIEAGSSPTTATPEPPHPTVDPESDSSDSSSGEDSGVETASAVLYILCVVAVLTLIVAVLLVAKLQKLPEDGLLTLANPSGRGASYSGVSQRHGPFLHMSAEERRRERRRQRTGSLEGEGLGDDSAVGGADGDETHRVLGPREREARAAEQLLLERLDVAGTMVRRHGRYRVLSRIGESAHSLVFLVMRKSVPRPQAAPPPTAQPHTSHGHAPPEGASPHPATSPHAVEPSSTRTLVLKFIELPSESLRAEAAGQMQRLRDLPDYHPFLLRPVDIFVNYDFQHQLMHESLVGMYLTQQQLQEQAAQEQQERQAHGRRAFDRFRPWHGGGNSGGEGAVNTLPLPFIFRQPHGPGRRRGGGNGFAYNEEDPLLGGGGGGLGDPLFRGHLQDSSYSGSTPFTGLPILDDESEVSPLSKDGTDVFIVDSDDDDTSGSDDADGKESVDRKHTSMRRTAQTLHRDSYSTEQPSYSMERDTARLSAPEGLDKAATGSETMPPSLTSTLQQTRAVSAVSLTSLVDASGAGGTSAPASRAPRGDEALEESLLGPPPPHQESTATYSESMEDPNRHARPGDHEDAHRPASLNPPATQEERHTGGADDEREPLLLRHGTSGAAPPTMESSALSNDPSRGYDAFGHSTYYEALDGHERERANLPCAQAAPRHPITHGGRGRGRGGRGGRGGICGVRWQLLTAHQRPYMPTPRYAFVVMPYERHGDLARFIQQQQEIAKLERQLEDVRARKRKPPQGRVATSGFEPPDGKDGVTSSAATRGVALFPEAVIVSVAYQLTSTLAHLHGQSPSFLHGAVTGSNVLLRVPSPGTQMAPPHANAVPSATSTEDPVPVPVSDQLLHSHASDAAVLASYHSPTSRAPSFAQQDFTQILRQGAEALTYLPIVLADGGMVSTWTLHELPWRLHVLASLYPFTPLEQHSQAGEWIPGPLSHAQNGESRNELGYAADNRLLMSLDDSAPRASGWATKKRFSYDARGIDRDVQAAFDEDEGEDDDTHHSVTAGEAGSTLDGRRALRFSRDGRSWLEDPTNGDALGRFLAFFIEMPATVVPEQVLACLIVNEVLPTTCARRLLESGALQGGHVQLPLQRRFLAYRQWQQQQQQHQRPHHRQRQARERNKKDKKRGTKERHRTDNRFENGEQNGEGVFGAPPAPETARTDGRRRRRHGPDDLEDRHDRATASSATSTTTGMTAQQLTAQAALLHYIAHHATAGDMWGIGCILFAAVMGTADGFHEKRNFSNPFIPGHRRAAAGHHHQHHHHHGPHESFQSGTVAEERARHQDQKAQAMQQRYLRNLSARAVAALVADILCATQNRSDNEVTEATADEQIERVAETTGPSVAGNKATSGVVEVEAGSSPDTSAVLVSADAAAVPDESASRTVASRVSPQASDNDEVASTSADSADSTNTSVERRRQRVEKLFRASAPTTPMLPPVMAAQPCSPNRPNGKDSIKVAEKARDAAEAAPPASVHGQGASRRFSRSSTTGTTPSATTPLCTEDWPACLAFEEDIKETVRFAMFPKGQRTPSSSGNVPQSARSGSNDAVVYSEALASLVASLLSPLPSRRPQASDLQERFRLLVNPRQQAEYHECLDILRSVDEESSPLTGGTSDRTTAAAAGAGTGGSSTLASSLRDLGNSLLAQLPGRHRPALPAALSASNAPHTDTTNDEDVETTAVHTSDVGNGSYEPAGGQSGSGEGTSGEQRLAAAKRAARQRMMRLVSGLPAAPSMGGFDERVAEIVLVAPPSPSE